VKSIATIANAARLAAASRLAEEASAARVPNQAPAALPPRATAPEELAARNTSPSQSLREHAVQPRRAMLPLAAAAALQPAQHRSMVSFAAPGDTGTNAKKLDQSLNAVLLSPELWKQYNSSRNEDGKHAALDKVRDVFDTAHTQLCKLQQSGASFSDAEVKALSAVKDKALAAIDAAPLLALTARLGRLTPTAVVRQLGIDPADLPEPKGRSDDTRFTADEKCALHLNSVSSELMKYGSGDSQLATKVWRAIGAAQRHPQAEYLQHPSKDMLGPLASGLAKLPHTPGITLHRGLQLGTAVEADVFAKGFKPGAEVSLPGHQICSAKSPYAGQVYLTFKTAPQSTGAVSTGDLNYNRHDTEGILRAGGRYQVISNEKLQPGDARLAELTKSTLANASSGRVADSQAAAYKIVLQELPRSDRAGSGST
jgi:hypothetical protein